MCAVVCAVHMPTSGRQQQGRIIVNLPVMSGYLGSNCNVRTDSAAAPVPTAMLGEAVVSPDATCLGHLSHLGKQNRVSELPHTLGKHSSNPDDMEALSGNRSGQTSPEYRPSCLSDL